MNKFDTAFSLVPPATFSSSTVAAVVLAASPASVSSFSASILAIGVLSKFPRAKSCWTDLGGTASPAVSPVFPSSPSFSSSPSESVFPTCSFRPSESTTSSLSSNTASFPSLANFSVS